MLVAGGRKGVSGPAVVFSETWRVEGETGHAWSRGTSYLQAAGQAVRSRSRGSALATLARRTLAGPPRAPRCSTGTSEYVYCSGALDLHKHHVASGAFCDGVVPFLRGDRPADDASNDG